MVTAILDVCRSSGPLWERVLGRKDRKRLNSTGIDDILAACFPSSFRAEPIALSTPLVERTPSAKPLTHDESTNHHRTECSTGFLNQLGYICVSLKHTQVGHTEAKPTPSQSINMPDLSANLEPFLLVARSTKGAAAAKVVMDATSAVSPQSPSFIFSPADSMFLIADRSVRLW